MALTARCPSPCSRQVRDSPPEHRQNVGCACKDGCGDKTRDEPACAHITAGDDGYSHRKGLDGKFMRNRLAYDEHKRLRALKVRRRICCPSVVSRTSNHSIMAVGYVSFTYICGRLWLSGRARRRGHVQGESTFIHECNSACACGPECRNRVLQHGLSVPVEVFYAGDKGWGVRINQAVKAGTFIIECVFVPSLGFPPVVPVQPHQLKHTVVWYPLDASKALDP